MSCPVGQIALDAEQGSYDITFTTGQTGTGRVSPTKVGWTGYQYSINAGFVTSATLTGTVDCLKITS